MINRVIETRREVIEKLKSILNEIGVVYTNILLFGSRTGQDFEEESDWDFLIVVCKRQFRPKREKRTLA